ncbi:hypothetical protein GQ457_11G021780 [Hibiscus cannabinus]
MVPIVYLAVGDRWVLFGAVGDFFQSVPILPLWVSVLPLSVLVLTLSIGTPNGYWNFRLEKNAKGYRYLGYWY